jgi:hypothetical protein
MGGPGQLFTYKELKSRTAKQGEKLKKDAARLLAAAAARDIARVIVVVRDTPTKAGKRRKKRARGAY